MTELRESSRQKFVEDVRVAAEESADMDTLQKLNDLPAQTKIFYHKPCKLSKVKPKEVKGKANEKELVPTSEWQENRELHKAATEKIFELIRTTVIGDKKILTLKTLLNFYETHYKDLYFKNHACVSEFTYAERHLLEKIQKNVKSIQVITVKKQKIIAPEGDVDLDSDTLDELFENGLAQTLALRLRDVLLNVEKIPLPDALETGHLIAGEAKAPEFVKDFIRYVVCGVRSNQSEECNRKVQSISEDLLYATLHGRVKTSKHITLGLTLKSITSSRKVLDIMNKFGHCCSYHTIEELETEATLFASFKKTICPKGVRLRSNLFTNVAFDNFDRYVETCTGKDTLHDTVGILIQNICADDEVEEDEDDIEDYSLDYSRPEKMRRKTDGVAPEIDDYKKTIQVIEKLLPTNHPRRIINVPDLENLKKLDLLWVMSHFYKIENTPMWVGFNCKVLKENSPQQKIFYLAPINMSPTKSPVVYETLRQCQQIAAECNQAVIMVTYDLAIAIIAMRIRCTEKPLFDNVFVNLGHFHIFMADFHGIGIFITDSGLTDVLVDCEIIASGSVNGVISGKHFNRCKRVHTLVALGLQVLHFEAFLKSREETVDTAVMIESLRKILKGEITEETFQKEDLTSIMDEYFKYKAETLNEKHGKTAKYYVIYIDLIINYHMLTRSIRTGNFNLLKYVIPRINNLFFVTNQVNYARWLLKYYDNLLLLDTTHPDIFEAFKQGLLGSKRTSNPFSRMPYDLTLEQTYNADAARRLTGITQFTNSYSARERWARSHDLRSTVTSHVLEKIGLKKNEDVKSDLQPHQITKDTQQLVRFIEHLKKNINPFNSEELDKNFLFNISTGRAAPTEVAEFLLNIDQNGSELKEKFIDECSESEFRFEATISRVKILNFASGNVKKQVKLKSKVAEVQMQRDLFGRMLATTIESDKKSPDVEKFLTYPLTPIPLSLCHLDGSICKTDK